MAPIRPRVYRVVFYVLAFLSSLAVLAVAAADLALDSGHFTTVPKFVCLALAVAVISLVGLTVVLVGEFFGPTLFFAWTSFELAVIGLLWVLWLASAADTSSVIGAEAYSLGSCDSATGMVEYWRVVGHMSLSQAKSMCRQWQAIQALGWVNWVLLLSTWVYLLTYAITLHSRGNQDIWTKNTGSYVPGNTGPTIPMAQQAAGEAASAGPYQQNAAGYGGGQQYPTMSVPTPQQQPYQTASTGPGMPTHPVASMSPPITTHPGTSVSPGTTVVATGYSGAAEV